MNETTTRRSDEDISRDRLTMFRAAMTEARHPEIARAAVLSSGHSHPEGVGADIISLGVEFPDEIYLIARAQWLCYRAFPSGAWSYRDVGQLESWLRREVAYYQRGRRP